MLASPTRRAMAAILATALCAFLFAPPAPAAPATPVDYTVYPHLLQTYPQAGPNVAVVGNTVFGRDVFVTANELTGLFVGEVVAGEAVWRGELNLPGAELDLAAGDWIVYVLKGTGDVQAVSIAVPEQPVAGAIVSLPGEPKRMALAGDRLYVACGSAGVAVMDILSPGQLSLPVMWGADIDNVAVDGHRVALVTQGRVDLLDFADPANPVPLGDSTSSGVSSIREVILEGGIAWVSTFSYVHQLDISDPTDMTVLSGIYGRGRFSRSGADIVIAGTSGGVINGVTFADFASGVRGRTVGWFNEAATATVLAGCIIGAGEDRVLVFEDGDRGFPAAQYSEVEDYHFAPVGFCAEDVTVYFQQYPDVGLVAREVGGGGVDLWSLDMNLGPEERMHRYAHHGSLAAVLSSDASNQGSPARLRLATASRHGAVNRGELALDGMPWYAGCQIAFLDAQTVIVLEVFGDSFSSGPHYLRVIDITDPDAPVQLDRVLIGLTRASDMAVSGDLIMVAHGGDCEFIDASDRLALTPASQHDLGQYVRLYGSRVFAIDSGPVPPDNTVVSRLDTWDVSDPWNPEFVGDQLIPSVNPIHVGEGWAIQTFTGTLFDLTGPGPAVAVGNAEPPAWDNVFMVSNSEYLIYRDPYSEALNQYRFLAAPGAQGVVSHAEDGTPRSAGPAVTVTPNPFNPQATVRFEVSSAGRTVVSIHDLRGRLVRTLLDAPRPAGTHALVWDGRDAGQRSVAAGVYLVRVASGGGSAVQKVALVK